MRRTIRTIGAVVAAATIGTLVMTAPASAATHARPDGLPTCCVK